MHATPVEAPRRRIRAVWLEVPAGLLVLAAIVWLRWHEPGYAERVAPVRVEGVSGHRVQARNFAVEVDAGGLQVAKTLLGPPATSLATEPVVVGTPGVWLSVPARIEALREEGMVSAIVRTRDGLVYQSGGSDRPKAPALNLDERFVAPGLPEQGRYYFELPPDRLEGARIQLFWGGLVPGSNDALVDVDLGIDAGRARALLGRAGTLDVRGVDGVRR